MRVTHGEDGHPLPDLSGIVLRHEPVEELDEELLTRTQRGSRLAPNEIGAEERQPVNMQGISIANGARVLEDADTMRDMAQRVLDNGPEPNYASEKIAFAVEVGIRILGRIDPRGQWAREFVQRTVERTWDS